MVVVLLDNPESLVLVTPCHKVQIVLIIMVYQIKNVITRHTENVANLNNTRPAKSSVQWMVIWELKYIFHNMSQGQLAISSREYHCWNCPFLVVMRE
jgi:hypothetical protein